MVKQLEQEPRIKYKEFLKENIFNNSNIWYDRVPSGYKWRANRMAYLRYFIPDTRIIGSSMFFPEGYLANKSANSWIGNFLYTENYFYRLGDYILDIIQNDDLDKMSFVNKNFPESLVVQLYNQVKDSHMTTDEKQRAWLSLVKLNISNTPIFEGITCHVRACNSIHLGDKHWQNISMSTHKKTAKLLDEKFKYKKLRIVSGNMEFFGNQITQEIDNRLNQIAELLIEIKDIYSQYFHVDIVSSHPDIDFLNLVNTRVLVSSYSGYSDLAKQAQQHILSGKHVSYIV